MGIITKYKNYILIFVISGILFSSIGAYAALVISSSEVAVNSSYTNKTNVKDSLDEIYNEVDTGKSNIINSLNSKGLELSNNATYQDIKNGIDTLPIGKTDSGEWGLKDSDGNLIDIKDGLDEGKTGYIVYEFQNGVGRALTMGMYDNSDVSQYINFTSLGYSLYLDAKVDLEFTWFRGSLQNNSSTSKAVKMEEKVLVNKDTRYTFSPGDNRMGFGLFIIK